MGKLPLTCSHPTSFSCSPYAVSTAKIYYGLQMTPGEIVAIVVASAVFLPLLLLVVYLTYIRVKEQREKEKREKESKEEGEAERMEGGGSEGEREEGGEAKAAAVESGSGWWFFRKSSGGAEKPAGGDAALPAAGEKAAGEVASAPLADSTAAAAAATVETSGAGKAERAGGGWRWPWQAAAAPSAAEVAAAHAAAVAASGRGAGGVGATGGCMGGAEARPMVNEMATKSHPNLVRLLGYCMDYDPVAERMEQIVIYEFVDNGDLDRWIGPLVMLTLITARKAIYNADADQINLKQWVAPLLAAGDAGAMRDPQLEAPDDLVLRMARLALRCTAMPTASRPSISRVLGELLVMKEEFLGKDEDRMAVRIDRDLELSSDVNLSMEIARAQGAKSSGGLSSNP
ncbi:unnamed protein product [Closterium sp. NIES-65]|nr:unnamed protein product [Closterium sp. NIES-65]